ncbi:hypothetical protein CEXT_405001 [Caerostris extrusa]|uniref:Uncharacterized protein n=1 Tax=Caerostris extrusa TaxID=172846 RepID=A0AAV4V8F8_CAEEX|nr:hypothetical protein CEXT_405001 [Caerostris extrusa]
MLKENSAIARPLFLFGTKGSWKAIFTATVFIGEVFSKEWEDFPPRRLPKGNIGTGREKKIFSSYATPFVMARVQQRPPWLVCNNVRHGSCATTFHMARVQQRSSWLVCNNVRRGSCATTFAMAHV